MSCSISKYTTVHCSNIVTWSSRTTHQTQRVEEVAFSCQGLKICCTLRHQAIVKKIYVLVWLFGKPELI